MPKDKILSTKNQIFQRQKRIQQEQQCIIQEQKVFYKPSQINRGCCCSTFDLRFDQMINSYINKGLIDKAKAFYQRLQYKNQSEPKNLLQLEEKLPINFKPNFQCSQNQIKFTWIGHATCLITIGNQANILIDPIFSQRCSPFQWIGPKRYRNVPCKISQLPKIDIVLVSHDHYDHCDKNSIQQLEKLYKPVFFAGLNSSDLFPQNSIVYQLDWTQSKLIKINSFQFQIIFVPTCHWSRRGFTDMCKRLWGGFIVKTPKGSQLFYSGDTGYCGIFKEIGQKFKYFDLSILPIGSYEPRKLLKNQHINPQDAVLCHKDINSKKSVGVHWGTFPLGREHWNAGRQDLKQAVLKYNLKTQQFITIGHGQSLTIDYIIKENNKVKFKIQ